MSLDNFSLPRTGRYEGKKCTPQRKFRKALRKEWKALNKATLGAIPINLADIVEQ